MIRVKIHTALNIKKIVGQREVGISIPDGSTVKELLSIMVETWGEERSSILFEPGSMNLLHHNRLMVNGQDIGFLDNLETVFEEGDEFLILPPIAGG